MKKGLTVAVLAASLFSFSNTASAADACEIVLCMFGKLSGNSQSECREAEKEYFSIVTKKKGKFSPSRTARDRMKQLDKCPSPENDAINDKFGRLRG